MPATMAAANFHPHTVQYTPIDNSIVHNVLHFAAPKRTALNLSKATATRPAHPSSPVTRRPVAGAAGAFGLPIPQFLPALVVGRAIRFTALALLLRFAGEKLFAGKREEGNGKRETGKRGKPSGCSSQ